MCPGAMPLDLVAFSQLRLPRVKQCCCGCSLEVGCMIIAGCNVVLIGGLFLYEFFQNVHRPKYYKEDFAQAFIRDEFTMALVFSVIANSGLLFYGVMKKNKDMYVPFLVIKAFMIAVNSLHSIEMLYYRISYKDKAFEIFIHMAFMLLESYQIVVVHSYYNELKAKDGDVE